MVNTKEVLEVLPNYIRLLVQEFKDVDKLQEIRIRINKPLVLNFGSKEVICSYVPTQEDIKTILQKISNYSIYAYSEEIRQGYITISGGHRVGICGVCVVEDNKIKTIKDIGSLNFRICREVIGCSNSIIPFITENNEVLNTIIISPPKCGKTTLLRDISRNLSDGMKELGLVGKKICIVDERSEIGACYSGQPQMQVGLRTDILDNCPKSEGIMLAIRSMSPDAIICDEIGTYKDVESIIMAMNSGVSLITTIHGYDIGDLLNRAVFKEIIENNVFRRAIILSSAKGAGTVEYVYDFKLKDNVWRRVC